MNIPVQASAALLQGADAEASAKPSAESFAETERRALLRLRAELTLVRRVTAAERERVAALAEQWGHLGFARFLREHPGGN